MKFALIVALAVLLGSSVEKPIREGYANSYSFRDDSAPGTTFIATTRPGLSLSDTYDPKLLKAWIDSLSKPAQLFYIRVYADHIIATNPASNSVYVVKLRDLVKIDWKK